MKDEETLKVLKKLRDAIDGLITVLEKDDHTEEEVEQALGKFMVTLMTLDSLE